MENFHYFLFQGKYGKIKLYQKLCSQELLVIMKTLGRCFLLALVEMTRMSTFFIFVCSLKTLD